MIGDFVWSGLRKKIGDFGWWFYFFFNFFFLYCGLVVVVMMVVVVVVVVVTVADGRGVVVGDVDVFWVMSYIILL